MIFIHFSPKGLEYTALGTSLFHSLVVKDHNAFLISKISVLLRVLYVCVLCLCGGLGF